MSKDNDYTNILLKQILDQNKAVLEAVGSMQHHVAQIPGLHSSIRQLQTDSKTMIDVVTATNVDLRRQSLSLSRLEQAFGIQTRI